MALKIKLTAEEFEALSEDVKKEYKKDGAGYKLDVDDSEVAAEMRRAKDREKQRADEAEAAAADAKRQLEELQGSDARKRGDIQAIEKSWSEKLEKQKTDSEKTIGGLKSKLDDSLINAAIDGIAHEIFTKPERDKRLLKDRVYIDYDGDTPILRVRDKDGKASAMTVADLKKETLDNKDFADILVGSKATGSGGAGGNQGGGAAKQPSEYTEAERVKLYRENPAEFYRLFPQR